jgi:hypothetical protein
LNANSSKPFIEKMGLNYLKFKQLVSACGLMLLNESQELLQGKQKISKKAKRTY